MPSLSDESVGTAAIILQALLATFLCIVCFKGGEHLADLEGVLKQGAAVSSHETVETQAAAAGQEPLGGEWAGPGHNHLKQLTC